MVSLDEEEFDLVGAGLSAGGGHRVLADGCTQAGLSAAQGVVRLPRGAVVGRPAPDDQVEIATNVEDLARRFPRLRLADGQELTFHPNISFRGPQTLVVRPGPVVARR
jgi:hypothetical protein